MQSLAVTSSTSLQKAFTIQFLDLGLGTSPLTQIGYTQLLSPNGEIHFKKFTH